MNEENLNELKETELTKNQEDVLSSSVKEDLVSDEDNNQNAEEVVAAESSKTDSPLEESLVLNVDYLDKKILDMKTINLDELESYNSEGKEIDDSIYDSAILDIKQNRIDFYLRSWKKALNHT